MMSHHYAARTELSPFHQTLIIVTCAGAPHNPTTKKGGKTRKEQEEKGGRRKEKRQLGEEEEMRCDLRFKRWLEPCRIKNPCTMPLRSNWLGDNGLCVLLLALLVFL